MLLSATSSNELSSSSQITTTGSFVHGIELNPPASGLATLKVYNSSNTTTTGKTVLLSVTCAAGHNAVYVEFPAARYANSGLYAVLTGTTTYVVSYSLG